MNSSTFALCLTLTCLLIAGCSSEQSGKGENVAHAFAFSAGKCLVDVRDNEIPYQKSSYCTHLGGLHVALVATATTDVLSQNALSDYNDAFNSAWRAVAINNYNSAIGMKGWVPLDRVW